MKVIVIVKATKNSEAGVMPSEKLLTEMGKYNEELVKAGIMQAGDGLQPSTTANASVFWTAAQTFLTAHSPRRKSSSPASGCGRWSMQEAVDWARRCPDPMPGEEAELEIRPLFEAEDFGKEFTPELRAQEERLRQEVERQQQTR